MPNGGPAWTQHSNYGGSIANVEQVPCADTKWLLRSNGHSEEFQPSALPGSHGSRLPGKNGGGGGGGFGGGVSNNVI